MNKEQKLNFLNTLTNATSKEVKYSDAWYGLWRQINQISDSFYTLFEVDIILDPHSNCWIYVNEEN